MYLGKQVRLERIINRETGRTIIVPMDHGVTIGAVDGLIDMRETVNDMAVGGADAVLMHKGLVRCSHRNAGKDVGLIVHLSASTMLSPQGNTKTLVGTVEEGIKHGADCVSVHVNLGDPNERLMLADLGRVAARPFRVNAGAVHAYARLPHDKTCYLGELAAGQEVLIVGADGQTSVATVGRVKIEVRPMLLVEAEAETPEGPKRGAVFLQNAETIRLTAPDGTPLSVVSLKPGDTVLCRLDQAGRHFGMRIQEEIREV